MAKSSRRPTTSKNSSSSSSSSSSRSSSSTASSYKTAGSYESQSTAPSSNSSSSRATKTVRVQQPVQKQRPADDISPQTSCLQRSSVETYNSNAPSELDLDADCGRHSYDSYQEIPPLPVYRHEVVDPDVRPSTPQDFAKLFPSMNRLSIKHDDFTPDGNMNLRVDTAVPGRRRMTMQLFHLRMHDLGKREFSLRRYCRESGREVCNSKRKYIEPTSSTSLHSDDGRPKLQRSMTSALKSLGAGAAAAATGKPGFRRTNSGGSLFSSKSGKSSHSSSSSSSSRSDHHKRPSSSRSHASSTSSIDDDFNDFMASRQRAVAARPEPSNTIKLEFSNYARVDVTRRGKSSSKRYEFEWWGHRYAWKRVVDKNLGSVSFHLHRDGTTAPVAHVVPETRAPGQVRADEDAGGWVPPCYMWIADKSIVSAMTDVADVVVATGLIALVDDCIKERWQQPKKSRAAAFPVVPLAGRAAAGVQNMFHRRHTDHGASPLRYANAIPAY